MDEANRTGLDEFFQVLQEVRKVALVAAGGLIFMPLVAGLGGFSPPWPPGIVVITSLVELVVLIVVFQVLSSASRAITNRIIVWSAVLTFALSSFYLGLYATFVYQIPNGNTRVVMGCGLSDKTKIILRADGQDPQDVCPGEFALLLSSSQYNTDKVWTRFSVVGIQTVLAISWLGAFGALAALVGVFATFQRRQIAKKIKVKNRLE